MREASLDPEAPTLIMSEVVLTYMETERYSHTAHVYRRKLLLVGGVWFHYPFVPGIVVVYLAASGVLH
ncbi:hypothetical protein JD844_033810 [Phrynosoma platyrhinos]|uniref:Uncharacterized protein n=1 Tax=Phrynosoma platyrhinos TaxID=52577 RepID=A0ABQ7T6I3_PHRPL|nr:hypothetical protein JD844_033810 [Phrynosoma platyrhinos]